MGRSGDPRKRNQPRRAAPAGIYWQPFRHTCGCFLEWGAELSHADAAHGIRAQRRIFEFLSRIKGYPCPLHGSATGVPAPPMTAEDVRYMPANDVWYKLCPTDRHLYANRLADDLNKEGQT